jgi:hypothetical protein
VTRVQLILPAEDVTRKNRARLRDLTNVAVMQLTITFCNWQVPNSKIGVEFYLLSLLKTKKIKLHGLSPRANYTDRATAACRRSDYQLFADRGCHVVSATDPYGCILGFLDRSRYFSIKSLLSCTHEAEWTRSRPTALLSLLLKINVFWNTKEAMQCGK